MNILIRACRFGVNNIISFIKLKKEQLKWIINNRHNKTRMGNLFPVNLVSVGNWTYGKLVVHHFKCQGEGLTIGHFCSIGPDVEFFLGGEHHPKFLSNYPYGLYIPGCEMYGKLDRTTKGKIILEDDVWIGAHVIILSGVTIGQGAVIGAGSIVAKDVPPYAIYANGEVKSYRFSKELISKLEKVDYSKLKINDIREYIEEFYTSNIEEVLEKNWLPKKYIAGDKDD